jgi:hypothetical protein
MDIADTSTLYLQLLFRDSSLRSLRDFSAAQLPLLRRVREALLQECANRGFKGSAVNVCFQRLSYLFSLQSTSFVSFSTISRRFGARICTSRMCAAWCLAAASTRAEPCCLKTSSPTSSSSPIIIIESPLSLRCVSARHTTPHSRKSGPSNKDTR